MIARDTAKAKWRITMIIVFENNMVHLQLHRFTLTQGDFFKM